MQSLANYYFTAVSELEVVAFTVDSDYLPKMDLSMVYWSLILMKW